MINFKKEKAIQIGLKLKEILKQVKPSCFLSDAFYKTQPFYFDFSVNNKDVLNTQTENFDQLKDYIKQKFSETHTSWGLGGYGEKRNFYNVSSIFQEKKEARDVHLGIDIWLPEGTEIFAPLLGSIHSFQDNNNFLDYGPTIILEHQIDDVIFYTLYGHLSRNSLSQIKKGMIIKAGKKIGMIGNQSENGNWPSHLHFQIIGDLMGKEGDFPGVSSSNESNFYLNICPDPISLLLR